MYDGTLYLVKVTTQSKFDNDKLVYHYFGRRFSEGYADSSIYVFNTPEENKPLTNLVRGMEKKYNFRDIDRMRFKTVRGAQKLIDFLKNDYNYNVDNVEIIGFKFDYDNLLWVEV